MSKSLNNRIVQNARGLLGASGFLFATKKLSGNQYLTRSKFCVRLNQGTHSDLGHVC